MKKKLLAAIVSIVTVVAMAPGLASASDTGDNEAPAILVSEDGTQVMPSDEIILDQERYPCIAPSTPTALVEDTENAIPAECDNGEFVREGNYMGIGFSGMPYQEDGWTGHFEAWLEWDSDDLGFRCTFDNGNLVGCEILTSVSWPAEGQTFDHYCLAYESATGLEAPIALHEWGCEVFGSVAPQ